MKTAEQLDRECNQVLQYIVDHSGAKSLDDLACIFVKMMSVSAKQIIHAVGKAEMHACMERTKMHLAGVPDPDVVPDPVPLIEPREVN